MKVAQFTRDFSFAPSSEDQVVFKLGDEEYPVSSIAFEDGKAVLGIDEVSEKTILGFSEQATLDQQNYGDGETLPGHADVSAAKDAETSTPQEEEVTV